MHMRRPPHTHWKYLLNVNPGHLEVHDLDNEKVGCQIDEIVAAGHAQYLTDVNDEQQLAQWLRQHPSYDGCNYCLPHFHTK